MMGRALITLQDH